MTFYFLTNKISLDSAKMFYKSFSPFIKQSSYGKWINTLILARDSSAIGNSARNFIKTDYKGDLIDLKAFKDKSYVLLDFWASWCVPCRELTPYLKSIFDRYHAKGLQIISVSIDRNENSWKKAIVTDEVTGFYHIIDNTSFNPIKTAYSVGAIPAYILIDKNGNIAGRYFGNENEGRKELDEKLEELFDK